MNDEYEEERDINMRHSALNLAAEVAVSGEEVEITMTRCQKFYEFLSSKPAKKNNVLPMKQVKHDKNV